MIVFTPAPARKSAWVPQSKETSMMSGMDWPFQLALSPAGKGAGAREGPLRQSIGSLRARRQSSEPAVAVPLERTAETGPKYRKGEALLSGVQVQTVSHTRLSRTFHMPVRFTRCYSRGVSAV